MMRPNLILMSHGNLASTLIESAKIILGDLSDYYTIDMPQNVSSNEIEEKLKSILDKHKNRDILIMTDLYEGAAFNIASKFYRKSDNICLISGMNLDMIIEYFTSDLYYNSKKFIDEIISVSKDSISLYSKNEYELYADINL